MGKPLKPAWRETPILYGEDARRFMKRMEIPCLFQETGRQKELQVATRLYALSFLHARQVYLWGD